MTPEQQAKVAEIEKQVAMFGRPSAENSAYLIALVRELQDRIDTLELVERGFP